MARQTEQAIAEADSVIFVVDGRSGLTPHDKEIANKLRRIGRPVIVAVNKTEGINPGIAESDFHELGLGQPSAISSAHGEGVRGIVELALRDFPEPEEDEAKSTAIRVAIVGRPNVGKSTMINTLLGEERVIAFDAPGTTRDSIEIDFERGNRKYVLIDTAGMRKRGKVFETIEKFSVVKTLQSIEDANVAILMVDAQADISDQDAHIADFIVQSGRALVVVINKWDGLDSYTREQTRQVLERKLKFMEQTILKLDMKSQNFGNCLKN
jgi:GTP-binding protein